MKLLLIDVNYKNSSTGKIVYDLYSGINESNNTPAVCYGRGPKTRDKNVIKFGSNLETNFHALMARLTGLNGFFSPYSTFKLLKVIKKFKPDIVHIHELHAYFVNISPIVNYLKKNKIKTIWTFHCEYMYTGKCGQSFECNKWKSECRDCPQVKEYPKSLFLDFTNKMFVMKKKLFYNFDFLTIVTPSSWLMNRVKQSFLFDKKTTVINNGIDTNIFHKKDYYHLIKKHNLLDKKIVLSVAPNLMSELKGGKYVLDLAERLIDENIVFILIGVNNVNDKDLRAPENVIMLGRTHNQEELAEYYSAADVFLICSKRETYPTTCLEALCCGTPIIGFDTGGSKEIAPDGYGIFIPYEDLDALETLMNDLIQGTLVLKSKEECSDYGYNHYDKSIMIKNYLELYNKVNGDPL